MSHGEDCFLSSPQWISVLERPLGRSEFFLQGRRTLHMLIIWPTLLRQMRVHRLSPDPENLSSLLQRLSATSALLRDIGQTVQSYMDREDMLVTRESRIPNSPLPFVYDFPLERNLVPMIAQHARCSIVINRMLSHLTPSPHTTSQLDLENLALSQRIWMCIEWVILRQSFAKAALGSTVHATVEYCPAGMQDWLLDMVNELKTLPGGEKPSLTLDELRTEAMAECGLCDAPANPR